MNTNGNTPAHWQESEAGQQLMERFSNEKTLRALDHLLARIDTLEKAVENLTTMLSQAPGMIAMAADSIDEAYKEAKTHDINIEERLANALHLAEKLTAPEMVEKINNFMAFADQAPGLVSMAIDATDEAYRKAAEHGVNLDERIGSALQLTEKITQPQMVEKFNQLIELSEQAPGLAAMLVDTIDEAYRKAIEQGLDLETLGTQGVQVLKQLSTVLASEEFSALMNSQVLSPNTLSIVSTVGEALVESHDQPIKKVGLFGTLRALNDPDRQKALGYIMGFVKELGKRL